MHHFNHHTLSTHTIAGMRVTLAAMRVYWLLIKAGFNPDQPRDEQGRWTDGGGGTSTGSITDPQGRTLLAQVMGDDPYKVDLVQEELSGGHALARHLNISNGELIDAVKEKQFKFKISDRWSFETGYAATGSFDSLEDAQSLVNEALQNNKEIVDNVRHGVFLPKAIYHRVGKVTGREAYSESYEQEPIIRKTFGVKVVIASSMSSPKGYKVITAFPANSM